MLSQLYSGRANQHYAMYYSASRRHSSIISLGPFFLHETKKLAPNADNLARRCRQRAGVGRLTTGSLRLLFRCTVTANNPKKKTGATS